MPLASTNFYDSCSTITAALTPLRKANMICVRYGIAFIVFDKACNIFIRFGVSIGAQYSVIGKYSNPPVRQLTSAPKKPAKQSSNPIVWSIGKTLIVWVLKSLFYPHKIYIFLSEGNELLSIE